MNTPSSRPCWSVLILAARTGASRSRMPWTVTVRWASAISSRYRSAVAHTASTERARARAGSSVPVRTAASASARACTASSVRVLISASRLGKWPYTVRRTTPAARAIWSMEASGSRSSSARATSRMRRRFASARLGLPVVMAVILHVLSQVAQRCATAYIAHGCAIARCCASTDANPRKANRCHATRHDRTGREDGAPVRPALVGPAGALPEPADHRDGQHRPHGRGARHDEGPRPVQRRPPVGDRRLHRPLRGADAAARGDRRQVQPTRGARARPARLRRRRRLRLPRRQRRDRDRRPCGDGRRRGADHAGHAVAARGDLPAGRAGQGDHAVDRHRRPRHRRRTGGRRRPAAGPWLVLDLPDQRADRGRGPGRRLRPGPAVQGRPPRPHRLRGRPAVRAVDRRARLHDHPGPALRLGRQGRHGRRDRGRRTGRVRPVGAAPPASDPGRPPLREPPLRRFQPGRRPVLPGRLRRVLLPHPAPPVRPRLRRPADRCADAAAGRRGLRRLRPDRLAHPARRHEVDGQRGHGPRHRGAGPAHPGGRGLHVRRLPGPADHPRPRHRPRPLALHRRDHGRLPGVRAGRRRRGQRHLAGAGRLARHRHPRLAARDLVRRPPRRRHGRQQAPAERPRHRPGLGRRRVRRRAGHRRQGAPGRRAGRPREQPPAGRPAQAAGRRTGRGRPPDGRRGRLLLLRRRRPHQPRRRGRARRRHRPGRPAAAAPRHRGTGGAGEGSGEGTGGHLGSLRSSHPHRLTCRSGSTGTARRRVASARAWRHGG
ncbi:hypothetical protein SGPA1_11682 [Streptomyces misionensis JCM 4497]